METINLYLQKLFTALEGWKTVIFNVAIAVAGLAEYAELINVIAPQYYPLVIMAINAANIVLRAKTKTPIFKKRSAS